VTFNSLSLASSTSLFILHMCNVDREGQVVRMEARRRAALQPTVLAFMWDYYG
jgi:hypothetical protein